MTSNLPNTTPLSQERARDIEARAGVGLKRNYWVEIIDTPLGKLSRRAITLTIMGTLMFCLVFTIAAWWRIGTLPEPVVLPFGDAQTVMTHVYANFSGAKDPQFTPFLPAESWRFTSAYTFGWIDASGIRQEAVILSYDNLDNLLIDYNNYTRAGNRNQHAQAVARSKDTVLEARSKAEYGSVWRGVRAGNVLLMMKPTISSADQQELTSHLMSIMVADHRRAIPTPTLR